VNTSFKAILTLFFSVLLIASCSRKKDSFVSRNFHAVTAEFNALYNGYNALEQGRNNLNQNYFDDYWNILPVEPMEISDDIILPGKSKNENFSRAEEKAVIAIQKHSMNIKEKEKNPQIDEAYLLLGKSRYFDQRFIPAIEAFNYILYKYPSSDKINQAKIWREKTNIRLENNELAIKNLKRLLRQEELKPQDLADATSMLAQAYINTKSLDSAITQLEIASNATKNNEERGRYRFIQGQLYNKLGIKDSANLAFDEVIKLNRRTFRIYLISAHLEKIKNFDIETGDTLEVSKLLAKLEKNRENRPYLDKIFHQIAAFNLQKGSDSLATLYFNKSLKEKSADKTLNAKNYEILGDMNFDKSLYKDAGKYYDSTMNILVKDSKPFRVIKRKRENLEDVIYYEGVAHVNDSILHLVNLSKEERIEHFEALVQKLKEKAEAEKKEKERQEALKRNNGLVVGNNQAGFNRTGSQGQSPTFYFYNPTIVAFGKNEFIKIWGDRALEDNWRWSNKGTVSTESETPIIDVLATASDEERFNPEFYISKIPSEEKVIDSISKDRNYAYYQLGLIYKEKFKELELAKLKFENLLISNPEERLILPSKYNLYKIYEALGETNKASKVKEDIVSNYPDSRYATILNNPDLLSAKDENSPESLYEKLYEQHENQNYQAVITKCKEYINLYDGDAIVPKFELLKATALGRLEGYNAYKEAINYVAVTYANTPEGVHAQNMVDKVLPKLAKTKFLDDNSKQKGSYKVIFSFENEEPNKVSEFKENLDEVLKTIKYYDLNSSLDLYNKNTTFVVVHGIQNAQVAKTFDQLLTDDNKKIIKESYFAIASSNYQIVQIHKNLEAFLNKNNNLKP